MLTGSKDTRYLRKDIGPTHGIRMKDPVNLRSFHGAVPKFHHMVLVHLRLGCAMYPVYCTLVNGAPADVVLGLSFRRKFDASFPVGFHTSQGSGVTSVCLGVPEGHALFFPKPLRERFADRTPPQAAFRQVLRLDTSCLTWYVAGKRLTPAQLAEDISAPDV